LLCILQAGIKGSQLTIALEPEAASIYCQELKTNKEHKEDSHFSDTVKKGSKCMVIDLGGKLFAKYCIPCGEILWLIVVYCFTSNIFNLYITTHICKNYINPTKICQ
jgi:hypothetical protein